MHFVYLMISIYLNKNWIFEKVYSKQHGQQIVGKEFMNASKLKKKYGFIFSKSQLSTFKEKRRPYKSLNFWKN